MANAAPRVTVCIPVYNRARYVTEAIDTVLAQRFDDFEVLVIDDGSVDDSVAMIRRFSDPRIRLERNDHNRGIPFTRNRCLELARGEYVALLDSDDRMMPDRLARQVAFLDRHPDIATLGGWVTKFDDMGRNGRRLVRPCMPSQLPAWLLFRSAQANTTLMARTAIMREFGYRAEFPVSEDYDLLVRLSEKYRMANLPRTLTMMREHEGRITGSTRDISFETKAGLMRRQLSRLGVSGTDQDLNNHFHLTRLRRQHIAMPGFGDWATTWLEKISTSNLTHRVYDQRGLDSVLGLVWMQLCLKLRRIEGPGKTLKRYWNSPLRGTAGNLLIDTLRARY